MFLTSFLFLFLSFHSRLLFFSKNLYPEKCESDFVLTSLQNEKQNKNVCLLSVEYRETIIIVIIIKWWDERKKKLKSKIEQFFGFFFVCFHISHTDIFVPLPLNRTVHHEGGIKGFGGRECTHKNLFSWSKKLTMNQKQNSHLSCVCRLLFASSWDIKWREIERKETHGLRWDSPICHVKQSNKKEVWKVIRVDGRCRTRSGRQWSGLFVFVCVCGVYVF